MTPPKGGLVLYKSGPARVLNVADKIEIELAAGKTLKVRPKDVTPIHPGPVDSLGSLGPLDGDIEEASELMEGESMPLADVAELVYGRYDPATAWATWLLLVDGLYFEGKPDEMRARPPEQVREERTERERKAAAKAAWSGFVERVKAGRIEPQDRSQLSDVEELALGQRENSRVLKAIGRDQNPANAHALLLQLGVWTKLDNPWPRRMGLPVDAPQLTLPTLADEPRRDLTALAAYAIDDEGNQDPDDAISIDGNTLWVHVADAAALITPDSELDLEARGRAGTLYLPELTAAMLPPAAVHQLGLGMQERSPALSIAITLDDDGGIADVDVLLSTLQVQRLSYGEVDQRFDEADFSALLAMTERSRARRVANGAVSLDFPEVDVKVRDGVVHIKPQPRLTSRTLVSEAMLMAGEAIARYAEQHDIPFPYATQAVADEVERSPQGYAAMNAARRKLRPRRYSSSPAPHQGIGLDSYAQVTSPLRRYLDLVAHQQLRAHLTGGTLLDGETMLERIGATDAVSPLLRKTERFSRRHWTLVWLLQQQNWRGSGVLVDQRGRNGQLLIPELALDARISLKDQAPLDQPLDIKLTGVGLAAQEATFSIIK